MTVYKLKVTKLANLNMKWLKCSVIAAVLKTVDCYRSGGSNPSLSAPNMIAHFGGLLLF